MTITSRADSAFFAEAVTLGATSYVTNGGSQSGTSLIIDTGTGSVSKGQTFTVAGNAAIYTVASVTNAALTDATYATTVTTVKFTPTLAASPGDGVALTFASTLPLPPHLVTRNITLVNTGASNMTISDHLATVHGVTLASGAGMTIEVSDSSTVFIKGTADEILSIIGS
jgi:hypothetical protein